MFCLQQRRPGEVTKKRAEKNLPQEENLDLTYADGKGGCSHAPRKALASASEG